MKKPSIGLRLTFWYLAIFAIGQAIFGCGMWFLLRHSLYNVIDESLAGQMHDVKRFFDSQKPRNEANEKLQEEFPETYDIERAGDYLQVVDAQGAVIYRGSFLRDHQLPPFNSVQIGRPVYEDRELGGQTFRFLSQNIDFRGRRFMVQMGLPTREMLGILWLFRRCLFMLAPLMLAIAAIGGHWLSSRALAPVDALTRTARTISASNLSRRLEKLSTGDELQRLADTLNEMLARIEGGFVRIKEFTADASHELRTPVSLIRTEAEIVLRRSRSEEEYREALRHILLKAENTSLLVERLLSLARADSGREILDMRPFDLRAAIVEIADEWRCLAEARHLDFRFTVPSRELTIAADKGAIRRLLAILLDNAIRYTPSPGRIGLSLTHGSDGAKITVSDSGIGISKADQPRIFERFYRAENARSLRIEGVGLGLAIAQWIVQQHQGSMNVESRLGEGSAFVVELRVQEFVLGEDSVATESPECTVSTP